MKAAITGGAGRQSLSAIYDFVETEDVEKVLLIDINEEALKARKELSVRPRLRQRQSISRIRRHWLKHWKNTMLSSTVHPMCSIWM